MVSVHKKKKKKTRKQETDEEEGQEEKLATPEPEDQIIREKPSDLSEDNFLQLESNHSGRCDSSAHSSFSGDVDESIQHRMVALSQPESSDTEGDATSQAQLAYQTTEMVIKATNEGMNHTGGRNIPLSSEMRTNVSKYRSVVYMCSTTYICMCVYMCVCICVCLRVCMHVCQSDVMVHL